MELEILDTYDVAEFGENDEKWLNVRSVFEYFSRISGPEFIDSPYKNPGQYALNKFLKELKEKSDYFNEVKK